jgi:hypothetical protein
MAVPRGLNLANFRNGLAAGGTANHYTETLGFLARLSHLESMPCLKNERLIPSNYRHAERIIIFEKIKFAIGPFYAGRRHCPLFSNCGQIVAVPWLSAKRQMRHRVAANLLVIRSDSD